MMFVRTLNALPFVMLLTLAKLSEYLFEPCSFNKRCTCTSMLNALPEVLCFGVQLTELPRVPIGHYYRINIIGSEDIHYMDYGYFNDTKVSSFTLRRSKLSKIDSRAFTGTQETLTTLDLSNNQIAEYPNEAFSKLPLLQWISLKANHITDIKVASPLTLRTLLLSDNQLTVIQDQAFSELKSLESLEIDGNAITKVEGRPFPFSITSLSLAHNLLDKVPVDALHNLNNIKWLQLRGNLITQLPQQWSFPVSNIEILDLSHNLIGSLSRIEFTSKLLENISIDVLHLDFNFIESLSNDTFESVSIQLLSLSNNKISRIDLNAFKGPLENELKTLDLNNNQLETYPNALTVLRRITSLFLRSNGLTYIPDNGFESMKQKLQALDLSANLLRSVPWRALSVLKHLLKLNLEDNEIEAIFASDFKQWSETLLSLSLSRNGIKSIEKDTFKHLKHLKELRLSYNNIIHCTLDTFIPLRVKLSTFEVSYAFNVSNEKLVQIIAFFESLEWLEFDHNSLHTIASSALKPSLIHLDLEGNQLLRCDFLSASNSSKLRNVILSYNKCEVIKSRSFDGFRNLITIVLLANRLQTIESFAFNNLPQLQTLVLTRNNIESIATSAFNNCSSLLNLYLQENRVKQLNLQVFNAVTSRLYINASHNEISELVIQEASPTTNITESFMYRNDSILTSSETQLNIRVLDLSNNNISYLPVEFADAICSQLQSMDLSFNALSTLALQVLRNCSQLVSLSLTNNQISDISMSDGYSSCCESVYSLNLASNQLRNISRQVFEAMKNVRIVDLSDNQISIVEEDTFANSSIQKLLLAGNLVNNFHFLETFASLRNLDLSRNFLSEFPVEVKDCENLIELTLQSNRIDELKERFLGTKVDRLLILNLSENPLRKIHLKAFLSISQLKILKLMKSNLTAIPFLPLPNLVSIDLSHNRISNISASSLSRARRLKSLDLSNNLLNEVPQHLWRYFSSLIDVNVAYNPIDVLDTTCFMELKRLRSIDIRGLNLKFIDSRMLHSHRHLASIKTSTFPSVRSFRLKDLLTKSSSLKVALIEVQESILSHQIQWAFGVKLKELIITGHQLIKILPDAFLGLYRTSDLILRITGTNVSNLPLGLLRYLSDVRFMTIDLKRNQLKELRPEVLYRNWSPKKHWNTLQIAGGLLVDENPLSCSCSLLWLSSWLRQWMKETRKLQRLNYEAQLHVYFIARQTKCETVNCSTTSINNHSLIDLYPEDIYCSSSSIMPHKLPALILPLFAFFFRNNIFN